MTLPLAVTMGDPAGIGGEITLKAWTMRQPGARPFYTIDDPSRLRALNERLGLGGAIIEIGSASEANEAFGRGLPVLSEPLPDPSPPGVSAPANAAAVIRSIERAVADAMSGKAAAVVTNPINKKALYEGANFQFPGHTEFLGHLVGAKRVVMMLAAPILRVVPVTIHVALRTACEMLSREEIVETAVVLDADLKKWFGLQSPRIAVSGLNPHAGEGGAMGSEEIDIITPAIEQLASLGIDARGPLPADTMFHEAARATYDAALCMYHDQALIPLKALDFANGVNVTLGLPFIRTSPDHGTAYDIAGTGVADPRSLIAALSMADSMAQCSA